MHIGIDSRLPYYQMGGISQYVLSLLSVLPRLDPGTEYTALLHRRDSGSYLSSSPSNIKLAHVWTPPHHRFERWMLSLELMPRRLDLLHSPDFIPPATGAKRHIITVHDLNFLYFPEFLTSESRRYYVGQIEWAVRKADRILADSDHTRHDLIERLKVPVEKIATIHLAANPIYHEQASENDILRTLRQFNLPRGFILFVGTLSPRKNIKTLIQAYSRLLRDRVTDIPLVLVGKKGWLYDEIFSLVNQLELTSSVRHISDIGNAKLAHLYSAAGLLALPSFYEGFGLPALEAMHCGCPVIVSNSSSLPEVVGDAGIKLEPTDVNAWTDTIRIVLADADLRVKMTQTGYEQAEKFSWEQTARQTLASYRECLNQ